MKNILYYFAFIIGIFFINSCVKAENTAIADNGRCTGSAYCSACSNCSRCGHCSAGGSCGVCSGSSRGRGNSPTTKKSKKATPKRTTNSKPTYTAVAKTKSPESSIKNTFYYDANGDRVVLITSITPITNIRNLPSLKGKVIEQIKKGAKLIVLENYGEWIKIKVKQTGTVGFVFGKNVR